MKVEILAMILAGGQGTRLGKLTKEIAKPAVPFGGKYRIIDFTLSNCINSGIKNIGVVTQYQPLELNDHVGNGDAWGLNTHNGGVTILQPYASVDGEKWFKGTAHAIYQNIGFIDRYQPEHVLILSGDHIYKMDYQKMLDFHKAKNADLTIGVIPVEYSEASRFGIMNTDKENKIIEFEEKPKVPKNNLASMGIYIFNWQLLKSYLIKNHDQQFDDFGKNVIPTYLNSGEAVYAYSFNGYWKDVGTIESLWEANMEFINPNHALNIRDEEWRIFTRNPNSSPQVITRSARVNDSIIVDGCIVSGDIEHSVLSYNVKVGKGSIIKNSFIMANVEIGEGVIVENAIIGENARLSKGTKLIGTKEQIAVVGYHEVIGG